MPRTEARILLVEDDEDDFVLTQQMLREIKNADFKLDWINTYEQALEKLCSDSYDVGLIDYRLGPRNGIELIAEALAQGCDLPIILLTAQGDHAVDMAAMKAGAADYLNKAQITADQLGRSIRYAIQQKKMEEQRIRLIEEQSGRAQAEAAGRAKDQFLANLSHELRTPLAPVLMAVAAIEQDPDLPERFRADVEMIRRNVELEAKLIDDLLDLTRIARGKLVLKREPVDLHALLAHIQKSCVDGEMLRPRQQLKTYLAANRHRVMGDSARLQQVVWNLVRNAIKFTPEGGSIELLSANDSAGQIQVEVRDDGIGIDPQVLPRIFEAFEQGDREITRTFGGLGLGLAICRALVELHGGSISASSPGTGHGATFVVTLATVGSPTNLRPATPAAPKPEVRGLSILLVEDHEHTARLMARLLERSGHAVQVARDIEGAKELAKSGRFDLMVSDLGLPDGSGLELMRHLSQEQQLPGIALSGYGMEADVDQSKAAGFSEHLVKPVRFEQLEAAIARVTGASAGSARGG